MLVCVPTSGSEKGVDLGRCGGRGCRPRAGEGGVAGVEFEGLGGSLGDEPRSSVVVVQWIRLKWAQWGTSRRAEHTLETGALREKLQAFACNK